MEFMGIKFNMEMLILIAIIYLIMVVHTIGGCCKFNTSFSSRFSEGFSSIRQKNNKSNNFFDAVKFTPKCCERSMFSSSHGCACLSKDKVDFLSSRGGNATSDAKSAFPEY